MTALSANDALLRARALERRGEIDAARRLYLFVLQTFPGNRRARLALAKLEGQRGRGADPEPPPEVLDRLMTLYQRGQLAALAEQAGKLVRRFATSVVLWNMLGVSSAQIGDLAAAETAFRRASTLSPDYAEAHNNLGNVLRDEGKVTDAVASYRRALEILPDYAEAHNNLGNALKDQGQLDEAIANYRRALELKPDYVETHINLGTLLTDMGRPEEALASFRRALRNAPDHAVAHHGLGNALNELDLHDAAVASYKMALQIAPDNAAVLKDLGNALNAQGKFEAAAASFRRALEIKPDFAECYRHLAEMTTYTTGDPQIAAMLRIHAETATTPADRCRICFALTKAYEDMGDLARAYAFLQEGNALRKALLHYDLGKERPFFAAIRKIDPDIRNAAIDRDPLAANPNPVFILGMPRSGTSLVEQIVSSHPAVHGAGELSVMGRLGGALITGPTPPTRETLLRVRSGYLGAIAGLAGGKPLVTDKTPLNFRFIGIIAAALPEARIIHVTRDPGAVCWSNYRHYFAPNGLGFSYDLQDVVGYYRLYDDLMRYWAAQYPDRVYTISYEALTSHQEQETRRLIAHLGLPWDDACLAPQRNARSVRTASQQQVRQAVYQGSSQAWKRYEPFLGGALDAV